MARSRRIASTEAEYIEADHFVINDIACNQAPDHTFCMAALLERLGGAGALRRTAPSRPPLKKSG